ncbi:MAG: hypothetical protein ACP5GS_05565 [Nitrososphaeria archaeon]
MDSALLSSYNKARRREIVKKLLENSPKPSPLSTDKGFFTIGNNKAVELNGHKIHNSCCIEREGEEGY